MEIEVTEKQLAAYFRQHRHLLRQQNKSWRQLDPDQQREWLNIYLTNELDIAHDNLPH